ncbi:MAG: hypothetical protein U0694_16575 [Anaerolineae bacterium]
MSADFLTTDGDLNTLNVVEADAPTFNARMQAFYQQQHWRQRGAPKHPTAAF